MQHEESDNAIALMQWCSLRSVALPQLAYLFHVANGGKRNVIEAQRMKREGVKAGVPDYLLPWRVGDQCGAAFELKSKDGRVSTEQKDWLQYFANQGWLSFIARDWQSAAWALEDYLRGQPIRPSQLILFH